MDSVKSTPQGAPSNRAGKGPKAPKGANTAGRQTPSAPKGAKSGVATPAKSPKGDSRVPGKRVKAAGNGEPKSPRMNAELRRLVNREVARILAEKEASMAKRTYGAAIDNALPMKMTAKAKRKAVAKQPTSTPQVKKAEASPEDVAQATNAVVNRKAAAAKGKPQKTGAQRVAEAKAKAAAKREKKAAEKPKKVEVKPKPAAAKAAKKKGPKPEPTPEQQARIAAKKEKRAAKNARKAEERKAVNAKKAAARTAGKAGGREKQAAKQGPKPAVWSAFLRSVELLRTVAAHEADGYRYWPYSVVKMLGSAGIPTTEENPWKCPTCGRKTGVSYGKSCDGLRVDMGCSADHTDPAWSVPTWALDKRPPIALKRLVREAVKGAETEVVKSANVVDQAIPTANLQANGDMPLVERSVVRRAELVGRELGAILAPGWAGRVTFPAGSVTNLAMRLANYVAVPRLDNAWRQPVTQAVDEGVLIDLSEPVPARQELTPAFDALVAAGLEDLQPRELPGAELPMLRVVTVPQVQVPRPKVQRNFGREVHEAAAEIGKVLGVPAKKVGSVVSKTYHTLFDKPAAERRFTDAEGFTAIERRPRGWRKEAVTRAREVLHADAELVDYLRKEAAFQVRSPALAVHLTNKGKQWLKDHKRGNEDAARLIRAVAVAMVPPDEELQALEHWKGGANTQLHRVSNAARSGKLGHVRKLLFWKEERTLPSLKE